MDPINFALLSFSPELNYLKEHKELCYGLSAVVQLGKTLWVANDETITLERLTLQNGHMGGNYTYDNHTQFSLSDYLTLPEQPSTSKDEISEADVEGLAYDNGYLWVVGSHSWKRNKPKLESDIADDLRRLATVSKDRNRFLLARIPVVEHDGIYTLEKTTQRSSEKRTAAQLFGDQNGNDLTEALKKDEHLQAFLTIPSKDNGFDIEGLAVVNGHIFIGLRGPVLRGWAVILELELKDDKDDSSILRLKKIGPNDQPYRKHFVQLGGLGIRDLCVHGSDLLILAGPTMDLYGPVSIFRWSGGTERNEESLIPKDVLERVIKDAPYGNGVDHAEGMTLFAPDGGKPYSLLIVYDSSSDERRTKPCTTKADIFGLPDALN